MYQALYRKYRPQTFSDVCGQPHITVTLQNELSEKRISHAYLFTGSRGTGKTSCAKILAKGVNCLNPQNGDPCDTCENCKAIDAGTNLDILEIDAASNNGVENIRDLKEQIHFLPANAKYRVYIIDEVHMLSTGAFNALLKTLEEPPAHGIFILATTEVHKLPATVISRCQRFDFRRIPAEDIKDRLLYVAKTEKFQLEPSAALMIGRIADGGMRDALSLLDMCVGRAEVIDEQVVAAAAGLADRDYLFQLADGIRMEDSGRVLKIIDQLYCASCDMERLCEELISHYRNLMILKAVKSEGNTLACSDDEYKILKEQAGEYDFSSIMHILTNLEACLNQLKRSTIRRVVLEMALLKICNPKLQYFGQNNTNESDVARISNQKEPRNKKESVSSLDHPDSKMPINAPLDSGEPTKPGIAVKAEVPSAQSSQNIIQEKPDKTDSKIPMDGEVPLASWPEVLERLKSRNRLIHAVLLNSVAYVKDDLLLIDSKNDQFRDLVKGDFRHRDDIRDAAQAVTGKQFRLGPYVRPQVDTAISTAKKADPMDQLVLKVRQAGFKVEE